MSRQNSKAPVLCNNCNSEVSDPYHAHGYHVCIRNLKTQLESTRSELASTKSDLEELRHDFQRVKYDWEVFLKKFEALDIEYHFQKFQTQISNLESDGISS